MSIWIWDGLGLEIKRCWIRESITERKNYTWIDTSILVCKFSDGLITLGSHTGEAFQIKGCVPIWIDLSFRATAIPFQIYLFCSFPILPIFPSEGIREQLKITPQRKRAESAHTQIHLLRWILSGVAMHVSVRRCWFAHSLARDIIHRQALNEVSSQRCMPICMHLRGAHGALWGDI